MTKTNSPGGSSDPYALPALDCHAHIAPDVTAAQLDTLNGAHIFAVTRSLAEAQEVRNRSDSTLTWGLGVHPGVATARNNYDPELFRHLLPRFALVGEIGLDKRAARDDQRRVLNDILDGCHDQPVLLSIHSTGMTSLIADLTETHRHPGTILHWWLGNEGETERVINTDAYFSVNAAMSDAQLTVLPRNRVLPETDFPARPTRAKKPGHTDPLEQRLATLWGTHPTDVRRQWWTNLRDLTTRSGALDRVNDALADTLLTA